MHLLFVQVFKTSSTLHLALYNPTGLHCAPGTVASVCVRPYTPVRIHTPPTCIDAQLDGQGQSTNLVTRDVSATSEHNIGAPAPGARGGIARGGIDGAGGGGGGVGLIRPTAVEMVAQQRPQQQQGGYMGLGEEGDGGTQRLLATRNASFATGASYRHVRGGTCV